MADCRRKDAVISVPPVASRESRQVADETYQATLFTQLSRPFHRSRLAVPRQTAGRVPALTTISSLQYQILLTFVNHCRRLLTLTACSQQFVSKELRIDTFLTRWSSPPHKLNPGNHSGWVPSLLPSKRVGESAAALTPGRRSHDNHSYDQQHDHRRRVGD